MQRLGSWNQFLKICNYLKACSVSLELRAPHSPPWSPLQPHRAGLHGGRRETLLLVFSSVQFSSGAQSCLTLCDPMSRSTPGLPVHHQLPEFTQTHVHRVSDAIQPSHPLSPLSPPALNPSQHQGQLLAWGDQSIGVSASASVLPMNTQDWSPSGWTGWISLQSKGLSRVFSNNITVQNHQFFGA